MCFVINSADKKTSASFVPERGGAGSSIIMPHQGKPRELLFLHEYFWDKNNSRLPGGWSFIFPICARLERMGKAGDYLYDGNIYNMPIHGFAHSMPWQVIEKTESSLTLELTHNEITLAMYPFKFKVQLCYKVENSKLICEHTYTNLDTKPMLYYAGFHPYFLTPPAGAGKEKVMLDYKPVRRFKYNERLTDLIGEQELFKLPISVADSEINEQLTEVAKNNMVHLQFPDGFNLYMRANYDMFRYLQLYTIAKEPFICVEPWMAFPNALNTAAGSRWLAPGKSEKGYIELHGD